MNSKEVGALLESRLKKCDLPEAEFSPDDALRIEEHFRCRLPESFSHMRALIGLYRIYGDHLPANEIILTAKAEKEINPLWDDDLLPFYAIGNGDYLCLRLSECPDSRVYFVPHDDSFISITHPTFDDYLKDREWFD
jgi:hypothetical protein